MYWLLQAELQAALDKAYEQIGGLGHNALGSPNEPPADERVSKKARVEEPPVPTPIPAHPRGGARLKEAPDWNGKHCSASSLRK